MEAAESPLDVLSRAAVMLQRNVLPPPSYDEARSLSQQQNLKLKRNCKGITNDANVPVLSVSSTYDRSTNSSGKWKREKKYPQKTTDAASVCDSTLKDYTSSVRFNDKCSTENGVEPLDMSKRTSTKDRGEPPSYFQSILCSNYGRRQTEAPSIVLSSSDEASRVSSVSSTEDKEAMCDQVINEHFRRSLGRDYVNVFSPGKPSSKNSEPKQLFSQSVMSKPRLANTVSIDRTRSISPSPLSVDDHFAKALGDTWIKLQQKERNQNKKEMVNED